MIDLIRVGGSFRDPSGHVYESDGRIYRSVMPVAAAEYEAVRDQGLFTELVASGRLVGLEERGAAEGGAYLLEHPKLAFISFPYEWSFSLLREAALFHIGLHLDLLAKGFTLSDSSAYNVQFEGPKPIFIDHLSIRRYREGEFWTGHRQFCEQFLTPLLLRAFFDVPHNSWYRGNLEGISVTDFARLLPFSRKLSWNVFTQIVLQSRFQRGKTSDAEVLIDFSARKLPLSGFRAMLTQLRNWIAKLKPRHASATTWASYASTNTYSDVEAGQKMQFIADVIRGSGARSVVDLGCNTGDYTKIALANGAACGLGFDFDQQALDTAHQRAKAESLNFLPLFLDAKNPSPDQGWRQDERAGFHVRTKSDVVLALAFEHHLAIAHNVPLDQVIDWIIGIAPNGVIEFVPKSDPTIRKMLALREDIFPYYTEENFSAILKSRRRVDREEKVSASGRTLYAFSS